MAARTGVTGIDPDSWQVTILSLPKRFSRGKAYGFCNGYAVGQAETARAKSLACWWPEGKPELLTLEGQEYLTTGRARGDVIPGHWRDKDSNMRAVAWKVRDSVVSATILHEKTYNRSWCTASGGGAIVGMGTPPAEPGRRARDVGLFWRDGASPEVLSAEEDVALYATDGTRAAGSVNGRAALWPSFASAPIDLAPEKMPLSDVEAFDGDIQVGLAWKGLCARAGIWHGTAASFVDLTPKGFQTSRAYGAAGGYQVGFVRQKDTTRNGSTGCDNAAVLWQAAADRWFDLNALLPAKKYNASVAWSIEIHADVVQVCGEASRYEPYHAGTPHESHAVPVAHPVIWQARLINA